MAKSKKRLTPFERAECVMYAGIMGDRAAIRRYGIAERTLYNYKDLARDPESKLAEICSKYAAYFTPDEIKPAQFADWLKRESMRASQLFMEMISKTKEGDVSAAKAVTSHLEILGQQTGVMQYVANVSSEWQQDSASRGTSQADRFSSNWNA